MLAPYFFLGHAVASPVFSFQNRHCSATHDNPIDITFHQNTSARLK